MDNVNRERMQHMLGGPLSEHIHRSFGRLENQAKMATAETHPSGWILALCSEISLLSGRIAELENVDDPEDSSVEQIHAGESINVNVKGQMFRSKFLGVTPTGLIRVQVEGEDRVRVVRPDKVFKDE